MSVSNTLIKPSTKINVANNYSAFPSAVISTGIFYWAINSQGTAWLPGSLGGTYYNKGLYYSNGITWEGVETPFGATQIEVNSGLNNDKFVTSFTFENASKWLTKYDASNPSGFETPTQLNNRDTNNRNRATHTGTQIASTISDIQNTITNNASVLANTAKITNANHTGEVIGSTALTVDKTVITNKTTVLASLTDNLLISDVSDTGNLKKVTIQSIIDLAPSGGGGTLITANSIFNFLNEEDKISITILNVSITNANIKSFSFIPIETSETSLDDFSLNGLSFYIANIIDNVSFDIIGTALNNASGNYTIKYLITI